MPTTPATPCDEYQPTTTMISAGVASMREWGDPRRLADTRNAETVVALIWRAMNAAAAEAAPASEIDVRSLRLEPCAKPRAAVR